MRNLLMRRRMQLRGESGAAFLLALLVLGSVMIFATFLLSHTQAASYQADTTAGRIEARLMAEAGVDYYVALLGESARDTESKDAMDVVMPAAAIHELSSSHRFEITDVKTSLNGEKLTVSFTSTGFSGKQSVRVLHTTVIAP